MRVETRQGEFGMFAIPVEISDSERFRASGAREQGKFKCGKGDAMRRALILALGLLVASLAPAAASETSDDPFADWANGDHCETFEATGYEVCSVFLDYWHTYGGLEIFGYPITDAFEEDGMMVQYFQRARLEHQPGVWPERFDVLQGLLGAELTAGIRDQAPFQPADEAIGDCAYFAATGHNVCDQFLERWQMSGGLPVFGYPISEAFEDEDGMLVQYFQRQRMEHQPGVWPERHDVLLGLLGSETLAADVPEPEPEPQPELTVVAGDLVHPRGILATDAGLYISEAGSGGDGPCITLATGDEGCLGMSGAITLLDDAGQNRIAEGIASLVEETGEGIGVHDIAVDDEGNIYAVVGMGAPPAARAELGDDGAMLATVIHVDDEGNAHIVADLAEHEEVENPDGTELDTNPYGIAWDGDVETVAVLETRMVEPPPFIEAPVIPMESVPTNVAVGPDGNYYVSELTGFPFPVGGANIHQITPDGDVSVYAEGFTNLGDLTFDADGNLWVVEILAGGLLNADPEDPSTLASRIVKIDTDGNQTEYMFQGMAFATGIQVGADGEIYVVNLAVTPNAHVLRIDLP